MPAVVAMPALADTLEAICEQGPALFYSGRIGQAIAAEVQGRGASSPAPTWPRTAPRSFYRCRSL